MKIKKVISLLCTAAMLLAVPAGNVYAGAEDQSVVVTMPTTSEPESGFDPAYGWGAGEHVHEPLIQSTLVRTTKDLGIENDLATEYSCSDDGLTWTVKIRDDVKFTDGEPLTASDVAFTFNTCRDESSVNDFTMLKEAVAVDDTTVEFHMNEPYSIWPYTMAIVGIVPEHAYDENYGQNPIGSGRYIMKQWDKGQQAIFEANPDYYGEEPKIKKLTVLFMEEDAAMAAAMSGQVDVAHTAASYSDQEIDGYELLSVATVDKEGAQSSSEWKISFGDIKGEYILMPVTEDEDGNTSVGNLCSDGVGDPYLNYNVTDDGETQEISATVYQVSGKSEHTQYVNPVFQKENGEIYAMAGNGYSNGVGGSEGNTMAATLSGETTTVENGKTKTEGCKVTVQFATMYKPVRTIIYQMNEANQVLKQTAYKPSEVPDSLRVEADTAYILAEIRKEDTSGKMVTTRTILNLNSSEDEETQYLETWYPLDNGLIGKKDVEIEY